MRFAYADPPYLGCCRIYHHRHEGSWGCWDDVAIHEDLLGELDRGYDGWAYSLSSPSLREILPLAPAGARVAAWVKPFAAYKANVRCAYTWEPVLFRPGRDSSRDGAPVTRDHLSANITLERGLTGAKPEMFCRWVLNLLGWLPGDEVTDIFPGTGVLGQILKQEAML
jgi:hypothetical protein